MIFIFFNFFVSKKVCNFAVITFFRPMKNTILYISINYCNLSKKYYLLKNIFCTKYENVVIQQIIVLTTPHKYIIQ